MGIFVPRTFSFLHALLSYSFLLGRKKAFKTRDQRPWIRERRMDRKIALALGSSRLSSLSLWSKTIVCFRILDLEWSGLLIVCPGKFSGGRYANKICFPSLDLSRAETLVPLVLIMVGPRIQGYHRANFRWPQGLIIGLFHALKWWFGLVYFSIYLGGGTLS